MRTFKISPAKIHKKTFTPNLIKALDKIKASEWTEVDEYCDLEKWVYITLTEGIFLFISLEKREVQLVNEDNMRICKINESIRKAYLSLAEEFFIDETY